MCEACSSFLSPCKTKNFFTSLNFYFQKNLIYNHKKRFFKAVRKNKVCVCYFGENFAWHLNEIVPRSFVSFGGAGVVIEKLKSFRNLFLNWSVFSELTAWEIWVELGRNWNKFASSEGSIWVGVVSVESSSDRTIMRSWNLKISLRTKILDHNLPAQPSSTHSRNPFALFGLVKSVEKVPGRTGALQRGSWILGLCTPFHLPGRPCHWADATAMKHKMMKAFIFSDFLFRNSWQT